MDKQMMVDFYYRTIEDAKKKGIRVIYSKQLISRIIHAKSIHMKELEKELLEFIRSVEFDNIKEIEV